MKLRKLIESEIQKNKGDTGLAAIAVCEALNDELDLQANGWFDNDPEMLKRLVVETHPMRAVGG